MPRRVGVALLSMYVVGWCWLFVSHTLCNSFLVAIDHRSCWWCSSLMACPTGRHRQTSRRLHGRRRHCFHGRRVRVVGCLLYKASASSSSLWSSDCLCVRACMHAANVLVCVLTSGTHALMHAMHARTRTHACTHALALAITHAREHTHTHPHIHPYTHMRTHAHTLQVLRAA